MIFSLNMWNLKSLNKLRMIDYTNMNLKFLRSLFLLFGDNSLHNLYDQLPAVFYIYCEVLHIFCPVSLVSSHTPLLDSESHKNHIQCSILIYLYIYLITADIWKMRSRKTKIVHGSRTVIVNVANVITGNTCNDKWPFHLFYINIPVHLVGTCYLALTHASFLLWESLDVFSLLWGRPWELKNIL